MVSLTARDARAVGDYAPGLDAFASALRAAGLDVTCAEATADDVAALGSSWAKRLGIPRQRPAHVLNGRKPQTMRNTG
jgi:hypothetical protein